MLHALRVGLAKLDMRVPDSDDDAFDADKNLPAHPVAAAIE